MGQNFVTSLSTTEKTLTIQLGTRQTIMKPEEYHYVVPNTVNVPTYTPWTIRVKARNAVGDAIEPVKEVTGYSGEDG